MKPTIDTIRFRIFFILLIILFAAGLNISFSQFLFLNDEAEQKDKKQEVRIPLFVATDIRAEQFSEMKGVIRITWNVNPEYFDDFMVGRSHQVIDSKAKALAAETVQIVQSQPNNEVLDFVSGSGSFYYVALSRNKIRDNDIVLHKNVNYTAGPVMIGDDETYFHVRDIDAKSVDTQNVKVTWKKIARGGIIYSVYRSSRRLDKVDKLHSAVKVVEVTDQGECSDTGIEVPGFYYYAVTAHDAKGPERMYPFPEHNYTMMGVKVAGKQVSQAEIYRIRSIDAKNHERGVRVKWTYTGTIGGKFYRIFRSAKMISNTGEIREDYFISDADITQKSFTDPNPPAGEYFYGILPYGYNDDIATLVRGVHITTYSVKVAVRDGGDKGASISKIEEKTMEDKSNIIPDKKIEKKESEPVPEGDIDAIIYGTFFKGRYQRAIKELQKALPQTDNEKEKAKANLFIGRAYVEIRDYRKALNYFILHEVRKHFRKESQFWEEYSETRLK